MIQKSVLKNIIVDNYREIENHKVINRNITFDKYGNYVLVGALEPASHFCYINTFNRYWQMD